MPARLRTLASADEGAALVTALGWGVLMAAFATTVLGFAVRGMEQARADQDWHAALAAADAGTDDFIYRLNQHTLFWQDDPDCAAGADPRCGYVAVPGEAVGAYRYTVDDSDWSDAGMLRVVSSGRVGDRVRTVEATLRRVTFIDYVYFTDLEQVPPSLYPQTGRSEAWARENCMRYAYADPPPHPQCIVIRFITGDVFDGPFRTNDSILLEGAPEWRFEAVSSNPRIVVDPEYPGYNVVPGRTGNPTFQPGDPQYGERLPMPPSNEQLRAVADSSDPTGGAGCLYQGPTFVRLNANGTMYVESPKTQGSAGPGCPGDRQTGPLPDNGVLFVETATQQCQAQHPFRTGADRLIPANDVTSYATCAGDLFIEGTLQGALTAAADNDIIITWHLEYADAAADLLGLAAQGDVLVFRPFDGSGDLAVPRHGGVFTNPRIDGALLSVTGSFRVQNVRLASNSQGNLGTLNVFGAIIQIQRGPVGVGPPVRGYLKNYVYDWRLRRLSPPFFIRPEASQFRVVEWAERSPQT